MMFTDNGPSSVNTGLLSFTAQANAAPINGQAPYATTAVISNSTCLAFKPYGFVWESASSIWMTETANTSFTNFAQYTGSGTTWLRIKPPASALLESGATIISIAGRPECSGVFMLYFTSPTKVYSFDTVNNIATTLATAPTNTVFRGVTIAPYTTAPGFA